MQCSSCGKKVTRYALIDMWNVDSHINMGWVLYGDPVIDMLNNTTKQAMVWYQ